MTRYPVRAPEKQAGDTLGARERPQSLEMRFLLFNIEVRHVHRDGRDDVCWLVLKLTRAHGMERRFTVKQLHRISIVSRSESEI